MFVNSEFDTVIGEIQKQDPRFKRGAYYFVRQGLDHTIRNLKDENPKRKTQHVSGQELLEGIREFALQQYGPMAYALLNQWGVNRCEDFGDIVFHLVEHRVLGKNEHDRPEDFSGGYDFHEAFVEPFLPTGK